VGRFQRDQENVFLLKNGSRVQERVAVNYFSIQLQGKYFLLYIKNDSIRIHHGSLSKKQQDPPMVYFTPDLVFLAVVKAGDGQYIKIAEGNLSGFNQRAILPFFYPGEEEED
jgi:hypothetical protein